MQPQNSFNSLPAYVPKKAKSKLLENSSMLLFIFSFISPALSAFLITAISSPSAQHLGFLQFIVMGVLNLPAVAVGLVGLIIGKALSSKSQKGTKISYIVSIVASVIGIGVMGSWFLSTYSS